MNAPLQDLQVEFEAVALADAAIVLKSECPPISETEILSQYAYVVDRKAPSNAKRKLFEAEQYGGLGIFNNGGGVRCGTTNGFQVKGIGLNPLLGRSTPSAYRSGALNGTEAVREYVWSKLIGSFLPNGAADVLAVIDTGISFKPKSSPDFRRFLAVREARRRIAHFERAAHVRLNSRPALANDSFRTRRALELLAGEPLKGASDKALDAVFVSLHTAAMLQAEQLAAAKMRRIHHGALSSSNAGTDGSWLDFGSLTHLSKFESPADFRLGFWNEFEYLLHGFHEICHVAELYSYGAFPKHKHFERIANDFLRCYEGTLAKEACGLLGIETQFLDAAPPALQNHLRNVGAGLVNALQAGAGPSSWTISTADAPLCLTEQLARLMFGNLDPKALADDLSMSRQFLESVLHVGRSYRSTHVASGIEEQHLAEATLLDATRRAAFVPSLEAAAMNRSIDAHLASGTIKSCVTDMLGLGSLFMRPRVDTTVDLGFHPQPLSYDPVHGVRPDLSDFDRLSKSLAPGFHAVAARAQNYDLAVLKDVQ